MKTCCSFSMFCFAAEFGARFACHPKPSALVMHPASVADLLVLLCTSQEVHGSRFHFIIIIIYYNYIYIYIYIIFCYII